MQLARKTSSTALSVLAFGCWVGMLSFVQTGLSQKPTKAPTDVATVSNRIEIKDFMFLPAVLTVAAGTKVTFVNRDDEVHTVASQDGKFKKSKPLDTDDEFSISLSTPGDYSYFCTIHPHMTGKITVSAQSPAPAAQP